MEVDESGSGALTVIDVAAITEKRLDVEMTPDLILGACNPNMAWQAIGIEPRVGAMLPCNGILRAVDSGVEVIDNPALHAVAGQVRDLLAKAVAVI